MRCFFFFNDTATTEIYTLSLHDALPIRSSSKPSFARDWPRVRSGRCWSSRSEEHTSELQSRSDLVCRLLLEKKMNEFELPYRRTPEEFRPNLGLASLDAHATNAHRAYAG